MQRSQRIYVIQRKSDSLFWIDGTSWSEDVDMAKIVSRTKFKGFVRADIGGDLDQYEMVEVKPAIK